MMRLPSTGWEKMSTFLEIYLICIINACSYGFLVACEHLWHAWNALFGCFREFTKHHIPPYQKKFESLGSTFQVPPGGSGRGPGSEVPRFRVPHMGGP